MQFDGKGLKVEDCIKVIESKVCEFKEFSMSDFCFAKVKRLVTFEVKINLL
jgi:hypothetical protein